MSKAKVISTILGGIFDRFKLAEESKPALTGIATKLLTQGGIPDLAAPENLTKALMRMVADGKLSPDGLSVDAAKLALESVLGIAGLKLDPLSIGAIKFINGSFDKCGGGEREVTKPPAGGPPIKTEDGKHVVVYCVETKNDAEKTPILPAVREDKESTSGDPFLAAAMLRSAFEMWELKLKVSIVETEDPGKANLIITGRAFGPEVPDSVLALTDIGPGPSWGSQLRMVFDTAETPALTQLEFFATASHELGHALGIRHADVPESKQLMSPMLSEIVQPQSGDLRAAVGKGWVLK